jgi:hypothetical protein
MQFKNWKINNSLETRQFSSHDWKRSETKLVEEYCWAIIQAAGRSYCGRSGSRVLEFGFKLDSLVHTHIVDHMYTQFRLAPDHPERNYWASREVSCLCTFISTTALPVTRYVCNEDDELSLNNAVLRYLFVRFEVLIATVSKEVYSRTMDTSHWKGLPKERNNEDTL